jgi:hypothetical protein
MHGKECEGRFLGVKLDAYSAPGARQDRQDVDMDQDTASGNGRPERPARKSGSHKGRQVTVLCTSLKTVLQLHTCSPKITGTTTKQKNSSSGVSLDIVYHGHQLFQSQALSITSKLPICVQYLSCDSKVLQLLQCMQCGFMLSAISNLHQCPESRYVEWDSTSTHITYTAPVAAQTTTRACLTRLPIGSCELELTFGETLLLILVALLLLLLLQL